jgi:hypothetical protein
MAEGDDSIDIRVRVIGGDSANNGMPRPIVNDDTTPNKGRFGHSMPQQDSVVMSDSLKRLTIMCRATL